MHFARQRFISSQCTQPSSAVQRAAGARVPLSARGGSVVVALFVAACAHSPYAAVAAVPAAGDASVQPSAVTEPAACSETSATRSALQNISHELQSQGMAMKATCQTASGGWVVQVRVTDGVKASQIVRGPLADGHDVDMGTPAGVALAGASTASKGFSPDVQHNRKWLHALMARHQFDNLPDAWWHFAQRGTAPAGGAQTDLAAR